MISSNNTADTVISWQFGFVTGLLVAIALFYFWVFTPPKQVASKPIPQEIDFKSEATKRTADQANRAS